MQQQVKLSLACLQRARICAQRNARQLRRPACAWRQQEHQQQQKIREKSAQDLPSNSPRNGIGLDVNSRQKAASRI